MKTISRLAAPFLLAASLAGCSEAPPSSVATPKVLEALHSQDVGRYALIAINNIGTNPDFSEGIVGTQHALIVKISEFKNDNALRKDATPAHQLCSTFNIITTTLRDDGRLTAPYGNFDRSIDVAIDVSKSTTDVPETVEQDSATYNLRAARKQTYCTYTPKAQ
jgi:hypothetical protein